MKYRGVLALVALVAVATVLPGTSAASRKLLSADGNPAKRVVNKQVAVQKAELTAQLTQATARQQAVESVSRTLYKADAQAARIDRQVDAAADRAARLNAKAAFTGSLGDAKRAAVAGVQVEKVIRAADRQKDNVGDWADRKVDNALDRQGRKEDHAADRVSDANASLIRAQAGFAQWAASKGGAGLAGLPLGGAFGPQGAPAAGGVPAAPAAVGAIPQFGKGIEPFGSAGAQAGKGGFGSLFG